MLDETKTVEYLKRPILFSKKETNTLFERFELNLYERLSKVSPDDIRFLWYLGQIYTKRGEHEKALHTDRKLVTMFPDDPICRYNLACSLSNRFMIDEAINELRRAIELGYKDCKHLEKDPDLKNIRSDLRFQKLLNDLKRKVLKKPI